MNTVLEDCGVELPPWEPVERVTPKERFRQALVITPGSAIGTAWTNNMRPFSAAMTSGWMQLRGRRRRGNMDKGFVLSDHADWDDLLRTVEETGAERIIATHGFTDLFSQYLRSIGLNATVEHTEFAGESGEEEPEANVKDKREEQADIT